MRNLDYQNGIVIDGVLHCITNKQVKDGKGGYKTPCDLCSLRKRCFRMDGGTFCGILDVKSDGYFVEAANIVYQSITNTWIVDPII